jgi:restriction system protein
MPIPDFQSIFRPLLALGEDGVEKNINDCISTLAAQFELTDEERSQTVKSGKQTIFANRVHWARTYLDKAGAIEKTQRSHFKVTERGTELLQTCPEKINVPILKQFPEFLEFHKPKPKKANKKVSQTPENIEDATPEERIEAAEEEINSQHQSELLERILASSPEFFERVVVDLIVGMGYGGSREATAERIGKSGDEGIDGVVNEDPLGLDVIYLQAKRYAPGNNIGREKIQQFAGALVGQGANKGVFVTTSAFTQGATEYAGKIPQRLILVDGEELTRLMVQYGIGVRTERAIELRKIDLDYFDQEAG